MNIAKLLAPLAALLAVAACTAPTEPTATKDVYYATPAVAAAMSPDRITIREGSGSETVKDDQQPYVLGESGFTPASGEDIEGLKADYSVVQCRLCLDEFDCLPICCPGQPHCQLSAR